MGPRVDTSRLSEPQSLIGTWRRFGATGPVYEIIEVHEPTLGADERTMRVRVIETGEELDYRLRDLLNDPDAR